MSDMNYQRILIETGLAATTTASNPIAQNFGVIGQDFGGFTAGFGSLQQHETMKLKCSTRTVSYSTLQVSTTTKA